MSKTNNRRLRARVRELELHVWALLGCWGIEEAERLFPDARAHSPAEAS